MNTIPSRGSITTYFDFFPQDIIPLYLAISMIIVFIGIIILINILKKNNKIEKKLGNRIKLAVNLLFPLLFFVILEFSVIYSVNKINQSIKPSNIQLDLLLFWKLRDNLKNKTFGVGEFSTNSKGLREKKDIPYKKEKDEYRILVLGDSWTFGLNVKDNQAFPYIMGQKFSALYPGKKITVINGGCPGYCIAQGYFYLIYRGIKYKPDMVIVKSFLNESILEAYSKAYPEKSPLIIRKIKYLLWKSNFYLYLKRMFFIKYVQKGYVSTDNWREKRESDYYKWILKQLDSFCKKKNIKVIYLNTRLENNISYNWALKDFASKRKVNYLEISLDPNNDKEFLKTDSRHPGPENHKVIADELFKFIEKKKLLMPFLSQK